MRLLRPRNKADSANIFDGYQAWMDLGKKWYLFTTTGFLPFAPNLES